MVSSVSRDCSLEEPSFDSPKEEARYWKQVAEEYLQKYQDVRDEFDEFQESSRELEAELEAQLEQYEQRCKDLAAMKSKLEEENELIKERLDALQGETYLQNCALQDENEKLKAVKAEMTKYIRELEQTNDDLERAKRATVCSLEDFEGRLNQAIERNAFLESELDEKEQLMETVQRLKDEARDLKSELAVTAVHRHASFDEPPSGETRPDRVAVDTVDGMTNTTPVRVSDGERLRANALLSVGVSPMVNKNILLAGTPLTPSARISALNIVSDLLRKVGALESKLASCRNFVQEHPRTPKQHIVNGVTSLESPISKIKAPNGKRPEPAAVAGLVKVNV